MWTHNSPPSNAVAGDAKYNYTSSDYAVYTLAGGTGTTAGADRPNGYIAAGQGFLHGFAGLVLFLSALLLIMAATSFNRAIRAMGAARWKLLHRSVYAVACLAVLHFFWMRAGKNNFAEVGVYAAVLGSLLAWRVWRRWRG